MRVIKFRAKRMDSNEWLFGSLFVDKDEQCYIKEPDGKLYFIEDKDTIGQFTGLQDKNGKEIYEGDIVCQHEEPYNLDYIGVVIYDSDTASFRIKNHDKRGYLRNYAFIKSEIVNDGNARVPVEYSYEVIGNVYEAEKE